MRSTTAKQVVGYARVSTAGQVADGVSLEAQQARLRAWAEASGGELVAVHVDAGLSGSKASNRPALQAALADVCRRKGVLVVYSLSRLARSTKDAISIAERLEKAGADLVSLSEQIDTTSAAGKMVFRMLAVLAEFERDLISERTRGAMAHLRRQGRRISGRIPFGYDLEGERLVQNEREQAALETMRRLRARGLSLRQIVAELESRNITAKNGGGWSAKVVSFVLRRVEMRRAA